MITLRTEDLRALAKSRTRQEPRPELIAWLVEHQTEILPRFGIDSPARFAMFIAQVAHETGGFRILEENLNYSAERLLAVWPKRFPSTRVARVYAHNPEKLGNYVYARKSLGNLSPGDGWCYRGRGGIQITGRACYAEIAATLGRSDLVEKPDAVAHDPALWWETACAFWQSRKLNRWADARDIRKCTLRINGGLNGFADRQRWYAAAWEIWGEGEALADVYDPTLELGDCGPRVEALQRRLAELRYPVGAIDGHFGKLTQAALLAFQKENDLTVDGIVGPRTEATLSTASPRDLGMRTIANAGDLKAAGSRTVASADTLKKAAEAATGTVIAFKTAEHTGLTDWMQNITDGAGTFNSLISVLGTGVELITANAWVLVPVIGVGVWVLASRLMAARVEDHQTGLNLSK